MKTKSPKKFNKGDYVRVIKLKGKIDATLEVGDEFIGTLVHDLVDGNRIYLDYPGTHWLITTEINHLEPKQRYVYAHTKNSVYRVESANPVITLHGQG